MPTRIVLKHHTLEEFARKWSKHAWKEYPAKIVTLPFNWAVLFGAEGQGPTERVGFFLEPHDARIVAGQLLKAAKEAENATS